MLMGVEGFAADGGAFTRLLANDGNVRVLTVEDFNTKGLGGVIGGKGGDDHFSRLVYFFGQSHGEGDAGGAFGFGKSVYSVASRVRTVLYYSKPADGRPSRLISVSLLPGHDHAGATFTGYALCGRPSEDPSFPVVPLEGPDADDLASAIGLTDRTEDRFGTSLMVLDCDYDTEDLRQALEKWWWPRIITTGAEGLVARFSHDGVTLPAANPVARPDLAPFVQAHRHFLDGAPDTPDTKTELVRSVGKRVVGKLVLKRIEASAGNGEEEETAWHECRVAMYRGPKLVVRYSSFGTLSKTPFVGIFIAEPFMNPILRRSENPAHDTWAPESNRLDPDTHESTYVQSIEKRCKVLAQGFQEGFEARPPQPTSRLHVLQELLGKIMMQGTAPGSLPPAPRRPVSIAVRELRKLGEGYDEATILVTARNGGVEIPARLQVTAHVLGDARRNQLEAIEVEILDANLRSLVKSTTPELAFEVPANGSVRYVARAPSPLDSPVRFHVTVAGRGA